MSLKRLIQFMFTGVFVMLACTSTSAAKKVEVDMWSDNVVIGPFVEEFNIQNPDIRINCVSIPYATFREKLLPAVITGTGPDMADCHMAVRPSLMRANLLEPYPSSVFSDERMKKLFPLMRKYKGNYYTSFYGATGPVLYYNKDLFEELGLDENNIPDLWGDLRELCKKVTQYDTKGEITRAGMGFIPRGYSMITDLILQQGGLIHHPDGMHLLWDKGDFGYNALKLMYDMAYEDKIDSVKLYPFGGTGAEAFESNKAVFQYHWTYKIESWRKNFPDLNYGVSTVPVFEKPVWAYGRVKLEEGLIVFKDVSKEKKDAAFKFIDWMYSDDDRIVDLAIAWGEAPTVPELAQHEKVMDEVALRVFAEQLPYMVDYGEQPTELMHQAGGRMKEDVLYNHESIRLVLERETVFANKFLADKGPLTFTDYLYRPPWWKVGDEVPWQKVIDVADEYKVLE